MQTHNKTTKQQNNQYGNERIRDSKNFKSYIQCVWYLFIMDCTPLRM
jgi:hypothetical protein